MTWPFHRLLPQRLSLVLGCAVCLVAIIPAYGQEKHPARAGDSIRRRANDVPVSNPAIDTSESNRRRANGVTILNPSFDADEESDGDEKERRPLPLPLRVRGSETQSAGRGAQVSTAGSLWSTTISLGLIVGVLVLLTQWMKRFGPNRTSSLPIEALEILGRRMLEPRVAIHFIKCGSRVLVLSVGSEGARTLTEIDDAAEVEKLTEACRASARETLRERHSENTRLATPIPELASITRRSLLVMAACGTLALATSTANAQQTRTGTVPVRVREQVDARPVGPIAHPIAVQPALFEPDVPMVMDVPKFVSPQQLGLSLKMLALMTIFSLAPSILMMTTCFVRFTVVLGLLRQAIGTQQAPPNQVLTAICLFLTFLVMSPVWQKCYDEGIRPYTSPVAGEPGLDEATALARTLAPVRSFMSQQIDKAGNAETVWMLLDFQRPPAGSYAAEHWHEPQNYDDVPFSVLAPAYLLSELKVGFLIGFQLFLPFIVIDLVVATMLSSLGLTMLPPTMMSIPIKLLLFVLIDGWFLTVGMLLESVRMV